MNRQTDLKDPAMMTRTGSSSAKENNRKHAKKFLEVR